MKAFYYGLSLSARMSLSISLFSIGLFVLIGFSAYRIALEESQEVIDQQMQQMAHFLDENHLPSRLSTFDHQKKYNETDFFIDIVPKRDLEKFQGRYHYLQPYALSAHFMRKKTDRGELKIYVLPLADKQIQISQLIHVRVNLAKELALNMLLPYLLFVPFGIYGLFRLIRHHLKPIHVLKKTFATRHYSNLSPIYIDQLPHELKPAIDELNTLFVRITQAQEQQQKFIANAAHELRTPLTALNLQARLLSKHGSTPENLADLQQTIVRMTRLVEQLLKLAQQEENIQHQFIRVHLNNVVELCMQQLMVQAQHKNIAISFKAHHQAFTDAPDFCVETILMNIIENAIKYSPNDSQILIELIRAEQQWCIKVHDDGQGISQEQLAQVTQRFVRLTYKETGSGLGLSIVQTALNVIGGMLKLKSSDTLQGLCAEIYFKE